MAVNVARSQLHVEGKDDLNSIANLVKMYGIDWQVDPVAPQIKELGSVEKLLEIIEVAVSLSSGRVNGFVLDADETVESRWESVRNRLLNAGVESVPCQPPADGYIGYSSRYKSQVGVWIMPDNVRDGSLEMFLQDLIEENDLLIGHAEQSTKQARTLGAAVALKDELKAIIHAWLAWQAKPGLPYGSAIAAKYFCHDKELGKHFVRWYIKLFQLNVSPP